MKTHANYDKKLSKFTKKISHIDDMMIHNFVKYLVQTQFRLWDIKITNHLDNLLAWNLLFLYLTNEVEFGQDILQGCVSSYHLHVCFFVNLDDYFAMIYTGFHKDCGFHLICTHSTIHGWSATRNYLCISFFFLFLHA